MPESLLQVSCVCFIPSIKELKPGCWVAVCNYHSGLSQGPIRNLLFQIRRQRPREVHSHTWVCLCGDELFSSNKDQAGCSRAFLVAQMVKNLPAMQQTEVRSLGWEDPLEKRNGYPLHYSCLENLMDRRAWWAIVHVVLDPTERLTHTDTHCVHTGKWRWKGSWLTHKVIFEALKSKDHPW